MKTIIASMILIFSMHVVHAESNFLRVPLAKGASVEIPKNWIVLSGSTKTNIDSSVEAQGYKQTDSTLSFAANLYDDAGKTIAFVNARFYPENKLTQSMAKNLSADELREFDEIMRDSKIKLLMQNGGKLEKWRGSEVVRINGMYVLKHSSIEVFPPSNDAAYVFGYRVWSAPRSFTLTISYKKNQEYLLQPIAQRIAESLKME